MDWSSDVCSSCRTTMPTILGIESSCDETSAAISVNGMICSNVIANQTIHEKFGGVVPALASRAHKQHIIPAVEQAIRDAKVHKRSEERSVGKECVNT